MPSDTLKNAHRILGLLYAKQQALGEEVFVSAEDVMRATRLSEIQINNAVELLHESGLVEWYKILAPLPFRFNSVLITARGKYEFERRESMEKALLTFEGTSSSTTNHRSLADPAEILSRSVRPPVPVGSPYGFKDTDWEIVARRKAEREALYVVLGCKFESLHYNTDELEKNIKEMLEQTIRRYNSENSAHPVRLGFTSLHAEYGEHLFNAIARDIISSDVAIFETSDLAPNVCVEIGVALTWGSQILLIKEEGCPDPPSDISGQSFADYRNNAKEFPDTDHPERLYRLVEQAIRKKG